jgi:hypothetical protein
MTTTTAKGNSTAADKKVSNPEAPAKNEVSVKAEPVQDNGKPALSTAHVVKVKEEKTELPPLEDRILKIQQLADLVERHDNLLESKKKIDSFKFASDGQRDSLTIEDSRGNEFTTSNSAVIMACVALIKSTLTEKIAEVDGQIRLQ